MRRSRPVKFMERAPVRALIESRGGEGGEVGDGERGAPSLLRAMTLFPTRIGWGLRRRLMGMVTARDSGRRRRPLQRGQTVADMYCIMYSR